MPVAEGVVEEHADVGQLSKATLPAGSVGSALALVPATVALRVTGSPDVGAAGDEVSAVEVVSVYWALPE